MQFKDRWVAYIQDLQDRICLALETVDGQASFVEDQWTRPEGGGGCTRVISQGKVFEKGGVNTSVVHGVVSEAMRQQLGLNGDHWFACGLSLVLHPMNPHVPTVHANWRYFELYDQNNEMIDCWFGGGADLTPYYLYEEDAAHFHQVLFEAIKPFGRGLYQRYKKQCDRYFNNGHRSIETRGIGGVFYDYLKPGMEYMDLERLFEFQKANGDCFVSAYIPIVTKRKDRAWSAEQKYWQEIRRGRYVEFNLIHDRGTIFGLKTNGRTESILMSLPPTVRFDYNYQPEKGSPEAELMAVLTHPKDWI